MSSRRFVVALEAARKALEAHAAKEPEAGQASGDAAKAKRKDALTRLEHAVGMLSKMSLAAGGRKPFEKAIAPIPSARCDRRLGSCSTRKKTLRPP